MALGLSLNQDICHRNIGRNQIHIACSLVRAHMFENTNEILHIIKPLYICTGTRTGYKFHNGLFMDQVYTIPTDVLSCLLDYNHESALPVHYCLVRAVFYLMSAALWTRAWFYSEICAAALTCRPAHCLQMGCLTWSCNRFQMSRAWYIYSKMYFNPSSLHGELDDGNTQS